MSDKELLKTIQNDIKNIDKCIDMCIDYDEVDYLMIIRDHMRMIELELLKRTTYNKLFKD